MGRGEEGGKKTKRIYYSVLDGQDDDAQAHLMTFTMFEVDSPVNHHNGFRLEWTHAHRTWNCNRVSRSKIKIFDDDLFFLLCLSFFPLLSWYRLVAHSLHFLGKLVCGSFFFSLFPRNFDEWTRPGSRSVYRSHYTTSRRKRGGLLFHSIFFSLFWFSVDLDLVDVCIKSLCCWHDTHPAQMWKNLWAKFLSGRCQV